MQLLKELGLEDSHHVKNQNSFDKLRNLTKHSRDQDLDEDRFCLKLILEL